MSNSRRRRQLWEQKTEAHARYLLKLAERALRTTCLPVVFLEAPACALVTLRSAWRRARLPCRAQAAPQGALRDRRCAGAAAHNVASHTLAFERAVVPPSAPDTATTVSRHHSALLFL